MLQAGLSEPNAHCTPSTLPQPSSSLPSPSLSDPEGCPGIFARPMAPLPAPLVYINGWPGADKLAVAQFLALLLGDSKALLVDADELDSDRDDWHAHGLGGTPGDRLACLLAEPRNWRRLAILADCTPDTPRGRALAAEYAAAASRAGRSFLPVILKCSKTEDSTTRPYLPKQKTSSRCSADSTNETKWTFQSNNRWSGDQHSSSGTNKALTLDLNRLGPMNAALDILEHANNEVARWEREWCCGGSAISTPTEEGQEWKQLGSI